MLQVEVLILKLVAVDGLSTGSIVVGEVATLCVNKSKLTEGMKSVQSPRIHKEVLDVSRQNLKSLYRQRGSLVHLKI